MPSSDPKVVRLQPNFQELSEVAVALNSASDELTKAVSVLDEGLKKLNIGLTVWVDYLHRGIEDWEYDDDQIGYCKVNGKWGLALRRIWGDNRSDDHRMEGPWLFTDAPREMRLSSVDTIPALIERLRTEASEAIKKAEEKTIQVREMAAAISEKEGISKSFSATGMTLSQAKAVRAAIQARQKFLGELVEQSHRWEFANGELKMWFTPDKHAFVELIDGRESLAKIVQAAGQVLGRDIRIATKIEELASTAKSETKGRK
jgi:hypothetical protein